MMIQTTQTDLTIENIVATTEIDQEIDVAKVGSDLTGGSFNTEKFYGAICRLPTTSATMLLFRSGVITSTGANSLQDVKQGFHDLFGQLRDLGIAVAENPPITVQNLVSSAALEKSLNLNALAIGLGIEDIEYEPEQFPGLVYRPEDGSVVVLLFNSGKLIITGAKTENEARTCLEKVKSRLIELEFLP